MWTQLTSADLDRAKQELNTRRTETLSRHAIELDKQDMPKNSITCPRSMLTLSDSVP